jgi:hypothetical protein
VSGSWNAGDRYTARANACKGDFRPVTYKVRVDDDHAQWRYEIAARALLGQTASSFFVWCAEYVIRHHRKLKEVRRTIRQEETEMRRRKRQKARERRAEDRRWRKPWKGPGHE